MESMGSPWASEPIAIIGFGCKFAGEASDANKLWQLMSAGKSGWSSIPKSRFDNEGVYHPDNERLNTSNIKGGHFIEEDIGLFDAAFFNFSAETAAVLDPQFRLQLESVYEALENAGLPLNQVAGSNTSVFAGTFVHDYRESIIRDEDNLPRFFMTGNGQAMASNRISHFFDFRGASMTIDTGCSTTLIALHQAVQSLRNRESDMSVVGGSNLILNSDNFKYNSTLGLYSPDGKCYAFDSRANGYGRGEGVATILVKRLEDAIRDGDPIRGVIRETSLNQDGKTETITSPSQEAQVEVMKDCYARAGLDPIHTQYFEAHGTGTPTGDPIEVGAISAVLGGKSRSVENALRIGSVKTNIGHTEATSALASIIKVCMALERGVLPPTINFEKINPKLASSLQGIQVVKETEQWPAAAGAVRRASVNNFGYGGSNAHVIIEDGDYWLRKINGSGGQPTNGTNGHANGHGTNGHGTNGHGTNGHGTNGHVNGHGTNGHVNGHGSTEVKESKLLLLSGKDEHSTKAMASNLADYLKQQSEKQSSSGKTEDNSEKDLESLVYTLGQRRTRFPWVAAYPIPHKQGYAEIITALQTPKFRPTRTATRQPRIGMIFTGQGAQWYAMGRELISTYPSFGKTITEADSYLKELGADWSLHEELLRDAETSRVNGTAFSIPICVAVQIALVRLLRTFGVEPSAVTSHSSGEIAAAYTVGALSLRTAMGVGYFRSKLAAEMTAGGEIKGGMIAVGTGHEQATEYLSRLKCGGKAVIACVNSPSSTTVAGDIAAVKELDALLQEEGVFGRRLRVDTAYHSHHMQPIAEEYRAELRKLFIDEKNGSKASSGKDAKLEAIAFASPVTGYRMTNTSKIADPEHWVASLLQPVQFVDSFTEMVLGDADTDVAVDMIVEIGPHTALGGPINQILELPDFEGISLPYYGCLVRHVNAMETIQTLAADLIKEGYPIDMEAVNFPHHGSAGIKVKIDLPPYPWNHSMRHWFEPRFNKAIRERNLLPHPLLGSLVAGTNPDAPTWRHVLRVNESPWILDHAIQNVALYPGCGFVSLAIEAVRQQITIQAQARGTTEAVKVISGYQLRDVKVLQALVVPDTASGLEIQITLQPVGEKHIGARGWQQFNVYSVTDDNTWAHKAQGLISVEYTNTHVTNVRGLGLQARWSPLDPSSSHVRRIDPNDMWSVLSDLGINYGPTFRNLKTILQSTRGGVTRSTSTVVIPDTSQPKDLPPTHIVHPAMLDAVAQGTFTALAGCEHRQDSARVFQSIDRIWISNEISNQPGETFLSHVINNHADAQAIEADVVVTQGDGEDGRVMIEIENIALSSLGGEGVDIEDNYWNRDLCTSILWEESALLNAVAHDAVTTISLVAHENPHARVLEIGASSENSTRALLNALKKEGSDFKANSTYQLTRASWTEEEQVAMKENLSSWDDLIEISSLDLEKDIASQGFEPNTFDLVLLTMDEISEEGLSKVKDLLKPGAKLIAKQSAVQKPLQAAGFENVLIHDGSSTLTATVPGSVKSHRALSDEVVLITRSSSSFRDGSDQNWLKSLQSAVSLATSGPEPHVHALDSDALNTLAPGKIVIFLGEVHTPLLRDVDEKGFEAVKQVATNAKGLVWITRGGAVKCEVPDMALAHGLLRSLRNEYLARSFVTIDLDPKDTSLTDRDVKNIDAIIREAFGGEDSDEDAEDGAISIERKPEDFEFAIRNNKILIPRFFKDVSRCKIVSPDSEANLTPALESLSQPGRPLKLQVSTPGNIDTLAWIEDLTSTEFTKEQLDDDLIEIQPYAYGVNFRDIMVAMGQLNDRSMGFECAGVITRLGSTSSSKGFAVGDKVFCVQHAGYGSRNVVPWTSAGHMPSGLSFEEAASMPVIFCTAYTCLVEIARLQKGQTVLIHAAAGGVGQAAIMIAQHIGAEIYATAGTPGKRELLKSRYGIPEDHIFSSRDTSFAAGIRAATNSRGVDVVLNSLGGDILQESFNLLARFGHFVEVGKRDLEINSHLEMLPFGRQASFTAYLLSASIVYKPDEIHRVMGEISRMVEKKIIAPVYPVTPYPVGDAPKAFRLLQTGKHMGKIVLTVDEKKDNLVPVLGRGLDMATFSAEASYLLVGGLGGLGKSIVKWMITQGAKYLVVMSRSASADKHISFLREMKEMGGQLELVACDITRQADLNAGLEAVRKAGMPPIRGVIQAAIVLQDNIFEQMTHQQYQTALNPKVSGTLNLHNSFSQPSSLDFFITLSSVVGVVGNASQANYAAANAYQDALAYWRVAQGLPAVSINLGAVKGIGIAAETAGVLSRLARIGHIPIREDHVLSILSSAILKPMTPQTVVGLNSGPGPHWDVDGESPLGRDRRLIALKPSKSETLTAVGGDASSLKSRLAAATTAQEATALVGSTIAEKLSDIFLLPVESIDLSKNSIHFGIDSLVAVELRNLLVQKAGAELSIFNIMQSASMNALAADVASRSSASSGLFA